MGVCHVPLHCVFVVGVYKANDLCKLTLCPMALINVFIIFEILKFSHINFGNTNA